jgi:hypothetical protein
MQKFTQFCKTLFAGDPLEQLKSADGVLVGDGSGGFSAATIGESANNLVQLDGSARLPAVDGSQLTGIVGGGGAAMPQWRWKSGYGSCSTSGDMQANAAIVEGTTAIQLFVQDSLGYDESALLSALPKNSIVVFYSPTKAAALRLSDISVSGVVATLTVASVMFGSSEWIDAPMSVIFMLPASAALSPDSGWVANADAGDKTAPIPDNSALGSMAISLNMVVADAGTTLSAVAQKVKALQVALAASKIPNV